MRKRMIAALVMVAVLAVSLWLLVRPSDPIVQGKRQSEWLRSLNQPSPSFPSGYDQLKWEQDLVAKQWRPLGPQGVQMLCQALDDGSGRFDQWYLQFYSSLDPKFQRLLPKAPDTKRVRNRAAFVLGSLAKENKDAAIPALLKALNKDPDADVRLEITACIDEDLFIGRDKERLAFLPGLIKATQNDDYWALRSNAFRDMRMYPDQAATLIPILMSGLRDYDIEPRWNAITTLRSIAPDAAKPEIVAAITNIFQDPSEQFALPGRIEFLGDIRKDALSAVPALLEETHNANAAIAQAARHALAKIAPEVTEIKSEK